MQEKSLIKKNILQYLEIKNITKYEFYQKTGITRGILNQNNGMSEENTAKFLAYFKEINPEWLLTGKGPMLKNTSDPSIDSNISVKEATTHSNTKVDYKEKYYELLEENRELRLKMERIEDKYNIELEKLKETHQKQVKEIENCKKELEKFRKSKNSTTMLPV
ncbi:MAG: transcriptional regulator [Bacteroidales bacterium]